MNDGMLDITVSCPTPATARISQLQSMFDVPVSERATSSWKLRVPLLERPWQVGCILGPSGTGKTTIARHLWPDALNMTPDWGTGALVDAFPEHMSIRDICDLLGAVGLCSPPAWIRPRHTLSNGEGFRADIAHRLAHTPPGGLAVVDEWTSVVDRQVAKVASHNAQKAVRATDRQLVAVTCHYDVIDWLQPDWTLDMASGEFAWRSVQPRPPIHLTIHKGERSLWRIFGRHHYLTGELSNSAQCFVACVDGQPVGFQSYRHFAHAKTRNLKMGHRAVVLPDWQGLGIISVMNDWLGQWLWDRNYRFRITAAHPAMLASLSKSPRWVNVSANKKQMVAGRALSSASAKGLRARSVDIRQFSLQSFEYRAPARRADGGPVGR